MIAPLLDAVRGEVSGERALDDVRAIAQFHRVQSSPGYDRAAAWMAEALETAGLNPALERVPGDGRTRLLGQLMPEGWSCARAQATLVDANGARGLCDAEREPLSVVLRSAPARGRFPLIVADAPDADGPRLDGLVALTSAPARIAFERLVLDRGAAGLLCDGRRLVAPVRTERDERDALAYTSFWWNGDEPRGWGFVVTPEAGDDLRRRLAEGARLELDVELESRRFPTEIPLVSARLGPDGEDREVLVLAHLCHPQPSANDNASGAAAALETARALAALIGRGAWSRARRGIRFLWMPELTGSCAWLGRDPSRAERIVAALNLDMVGEDQHACGSTFLLERPPWFAASFAEELLGAVRFAAQDWVPSYSGPGHFGMSRMAEVPYGGGSDHAVLLDPSVGVPCPMLIQWPDRFYHSSHDTPDRCDPRSLELAARCAATYAAFLASAGPAEVEWLGRRVVRAARVRLLRALDEGQPRGVERERRRGATALGSMARLGMDPKTIAEEIRRFESFATMEGGGEEARVPGSAPDAGTVWRRDAGPLDFLKHLSAGWERLTAGERQAWRDLEAAHADPLFDVAWMATDGRRTFGDVVRATWLETGRWEPDALARFFDWTRRTGRAAPVPSTPHGRQA